MEMKLLHRGATVFMIFNGFVIIYFMYSPERSKGLQSWFSHHLGNGESSSKKVAAFDSEAVRKDEGLLAETHRLHEDFKKMIDKSNVDKGNRIIKKNNKDDQWLSATKKDNKGKGVLLENNIKVATKSVSIKHVQTEKNNRVDLKMQEELKKMRKQKMKSRNKIILIYTGLHKREEWYNLPKKKLKNYLKNSKCKYNSCRVTYQKGLFSIADAVIFHERNMPSVDMLEQLTKFGNRPPNQRWIFFTSESPKNAEFNVVPYNSFFNWTMTYKVDSDIYLPYLQYRKLSKHDKRPDSNIDYAKNKKRTIAWFVSNCKFGLRMEFVFALEKFTNVYVGGGCRDEFEKKINCTRWCDDNLHNYKFFLSLENGICTDYITEKYWNYLEKGLVPIVLGGANYSNPRLAIPGSFIDASAFDSIEQLANYINYLDKNDTAYNDYFKWKQRYRIWHPAHGDWPFESYFLCKICKMLGQDLPKKVYHKLSDFWDEYTDCEMPEDRVRKKLILEGYTFEERARMEDRKNREESAKISVDFDESDPVQFE